MPLSRGTRLGTYEVLAPIGAGGMGEVWRARDTKLARDVAVKVLPDHLSDDPRALARFENEAKAVAALSHPHILSIFDFGTSEGISYVVMELLEGETLRVLLARGPLPLRKALEIASQLADALAAAHEKEIVHRDVKPENVVVTKDGRAKLLDFGLARQDPTFRSGDDSRSPTLTRNTDPGAIVGTVAYMSPEQAQGLPAGFRSDQFSLGTVLYEMLTGRRPFHGPSSAETLTAIIRADHEPIGGVVPAPVRWIVDRLLAKDPADRYAATRDLARDLETCRLRLSEATTSAVDESAAKSAAKAGRRGAWLAAGTVALLCAVVGAYRLGSVRGDAKRSSAAVPKLVQLTWEAGAEGQPSISPDGGSFLYVAGPPGNSDIFVRRVGGETATNLTKSFGGSDARPAYSPDGRSIAFWSEREGGGIFVMGATGESPRRLTDVGVGPRWSPGGGEIVYTIKGAEASAAEIWIVDVATGAKRKVYDGNGIDPTWSPGGKRIAFHQRPLGDALGQRESLSTIPVAGGTPREVLEIPGSLASEPYWAGEWLYFVSAAGGSPNVWRVRVDESSGERIGAAEPVITTELSYHPASTPDGRRLVCDFLRLSNKLERYAFDPIKGRLLGEAKEVLSISRQMDLAAVSPDARWLAVVLFEHDGGQDLLLVRADTGETRRMTNDSLREDYFVWAPDSSRLYFAVARGGVSETWSIHSDGSGRELVVPRVGDEGVKPAWASPDGRTLYVRVGTAERLHTVDLGLPLERRSPVPLPRPESGGEFDVASGSPDGQWLVGYPTRVSSGVRRPLLLYDVRRRTYETLAELEANRPCAFLPDSRRILLHRLGRLEILDRVTRKMTPAGDVSSHTGEIGVSADGRSLFTMSGSWDGDIWMLDYGKER